MKHRQAAVPCVCCVILLTRTHAHTHTHTHTHTHPLFHTYTQTHGDINTCTFALSCSRALMRTRAKGDHAVEKEALEAFYAEETQVCRTL